MDLRSRHAAGRGFATAGWRTAPGPRVATTAPPLDLLKACGAVLRLPGRSNNRGLFHQRYRYLDVGDHVLSHRAQQHAGETGMAARTDDDQAGAKLGDKVVHHLALAAD